MAGGAGCVARPEQSTKKLSGRVAWEPAGPAAAGDRAGVRLGSRVVCEKRALAGWAEGRG